MPTYLYEYFCVLFELRWLKFNLKKFSSLLVEIHASPDPISFYTITSDTAIIITHHFKKHCEIPFVLGVSFWCNLGKATVVFARNYVVITQESFFSVSCYKKESARLKYKTWCYVAKDGKCE